MKPKSPENFSRFRNPLYLPAALLVILAFFIYQAQVQKTFSVSSDLEKSTGNKFTAWDGEDQDSSDSAPAQALASSISAVHLDHLVISEVFSNLDAAGVGTEWIEVYNGTDGKADLSGMELSAADDSFFVFPKDFELDQFSFAVVHWGADGENTRTDLFTGTEGFDQNMGNASGWVALFKNNIHSKDTIIDYIEYGAGSQTAESKAVDAGIWTAGAFIPDVVEGHSMEKKEKDIDANLVSEFKDQATPTPGL